MTFEEKVERLNELKNDPNKSSVIYESMSYDEKVKWLKIQSQKHSLSESTNGFVDGVELNGESVDDYIKRNRLITFEEVKNKIHNIIG